MSSPGHNVSPAFGGELGGTGTKVQSEPKMPPKTVSARSRHLVATNRRASGRAPLIIPSTLRGTLPRPSGSRMFGV